MKSASASRSAVVLGGGVIGLFSAWRLLDAGFAVTLIDSRRIGGSASWAGGGILSPLPPWRAPPPVWQMAAASLREYPAIAAELGEQTGIDPEWTESGMQVLELEADEADAARRWGAQQGQAVLAAQREYAGVMRSELHLPWVAQVRSPRLLQALAALLRQRGARLVEQAVGARLLRQGTTMSGVTADDGSLYRADCYVLCSGAWTGQLTAGQGAAVPVTPMRGQMLLLQGQPGQLASIVLAGAHYLIPRRDGRILVGSTLESVGFDERLTDAARDTLLAFAHRTAPCTQAMPVIGHWCGLRPASPEGVPLVQRAEFADEVFINAGHFRNGITLAPASARQLVALIANRS